METDFLPKNLFIIPETDMRHILLSLKQEDINAVHITNGFYNRPQVEVVPTTLANFRYAIDQRSRADQHGQVDQEKQPRTTALLLAINSGDSYRRFLRNKGKPEVEVRSVESWFTRATKVAVPVALQFPRRKVAVISFNEDTPKELFDHLGGKGHIRIRSISKYGYGYNGKGIIEGGAYAEHLYAHPLPGNKDVEGDLLTRRQGQEGPAIQFSDLTLVRGKHKAPYLSKDGKVLFDVEDPDLLEFSATGIVSPHAPKHKVRPQAIKGPTI